MNLSPFVDNLRGKNSDLLGMFSRSRWFLFPYARLALWRLLKTIFSSGKRRIYLPGFICRGLLSAIAQSGNEAVFYEVDEHLNPILDFSVSASAIVAVNYFGFPQPLSPFLEYSRKQGALLIEDNAHGFGSKSKTDEFLGTRGDFGLFSFRKTFAFPSGGGLLINNPSYFSKRFFSSGAALKEKDLFFLVKRILRRFLRASGDWLGIGFLRLRRYLRVLQTGFPLPQSNAESECELPEDRMLSPFFKPSRVTIDLGKESRRRRESFRRVKMLSSSFCIKPLYENLEPGTVPYCFPFQASGTEAERFEQFLFTEGFFVLPWPDLPERVAKSCPAFYSQIFMVPFLW